MCSSDIKGKLRKTLAKTKDEEDGQVMLQLKCVLTLSTTDLKRSNNIQTQRVLDEYIWTQPPVAITAEAHVELYLVGSGSVYGGEWGERTNQQEGRCVGVRVRVRVYDHHMSFVLVNMNASYLLLTRQTLGLIVAHRSKSLPMLGLDSKL